MRKRVGKQIDQSLPTTVASVWVRVRLSFGVIDEQFENKKKVKN